MDVEFWMDMNLLSAGIFWQGVWFAVGFFGGLFIWWPVVRAVCGSR